MRGLARNANQQPNSKIAVYPVSAEGMMHEHILEADNAGPAAPQGGGHIGSEMDPGNPLFAGGAGLAGEVRFDPIAENWLHAPNDFTSDALMSDLRQCAGELDAA